MKKSPDVGAQHAAPSVAMRMTGSLHRAPMSKNQNLIVVLLFLVCVATSCSSSDTGCPCCHGLSPVNILDAAPDGEHVNAGDYKFRLAGVDASNPATSAKAKAFIDYWLLKHDEYFKRVTNEEVGGMKDENGLYLIWVQCGCHRDLLNEALIREGLAHLREEPGQKLKYAPQMREAGKLSSK